jgi:hypothetical protein
VNEEIFFEKMTQIIMDKIYLKIKRASKLNLPAPDYPKPNIKLLH